MTLFQIIAVLFTIAALFSVVNEKYIDLPHTIGMVVFALISSIAIIALDSVVPFSIAQVFTEIMSSVDFHETLMQYFLGALLFAGSITVSYQSLKKQLVPVMTFATAGVLISTFAVGTGMFYVLPLVGIHIPYIWCLVFGAAISPTDPIAVMGLLKTLVVPESLESKIAGESLFNDGAAIVMFTVLLGLATGVAGHIPLEPVHIIKLFIAEAFGGALLGLTTGFVAYKMISATKKPITELLVTLALATVTYALALSAHMSAPIAVVVAGLFIGEGHRKNSAKKKNEEHQVHTIWEGLDEVLNTILFLILGLEVFVISVTASSMIVGLIAIPVVLFARWLSVFLPVLVLKHFGQTFSRGTTTILTWGGLRGGISVALILSLPATSFTPLILAAAYAVVLWTIIVQGLSMKRLILYFYPPEQEEQKS